MRLEITRLMVTMLGSLSVSALLVALATTAFA